MGCYPPYSLGMAQVCNDSDTLLLQQDLNQLSEWASNWLLKFSIAKCMVLPLGKSRVTTYTMTDAAAWFTDFLISSFPGQRFGCMVNGLTMQCQKAAGHGNYQEII